MGKYIQYFDSVNAFLNSDVSLDDDKPFVGMVGSDRIVYSPSLYIDDAGHNYVDLGLPSGTLWATDDLSGYYYWGESTGATDGHANTYGTDNNWSKYNQDDGLLYLELQDDTAHNIWGGNWVVPTYADWEELFDYTTRTSTNSGRKFTFTSTENGESIEMSWKGHWFVNSLNGLGSNEFRMVSQLSGDGTYNKICAAQINNSLISDIYYRSSYGIPVRPVIHPERKWYNKPQLHF